MTTLFRSQFGNLWLLHLGTRPRRRFSAVGALHVSAGMVPFLFVTILLWDSLQAPLMTTSPDEPVVDASTLKQFGAVHGRPEQYRVATALLPAPFGELQVSAVTRSATSESVRNAIGTEFVKVPPGTFLMGCSLEGKQCPVTELPRHEVTITKPFEIGKFKVTKKEWLQVMGPTASVLLTDKSDDFPVHAVRWTDVQAFLQTLNEMQDGYAYRLPTEAEWEYAARAGVSEQRYGDLDSIGWHRGNSGNSLHPVGQKLPNAWGLYDVIGNSTEWVADWYGPYESHSQKDPVGPSKAICLLADRRDGTPCDYRVLRGSLANEGPVDSTLSHRSFEHQSAGAMIFTFRYVREATASKR